MTEKKMEHPYLALGEAMVLSILTGNRAKIGGEKLGLSGRLRQMSYYVTENSAGAGDALLSTDLLDAANQLDPDRQRLTDTQLKAGVEALRAARNKFGDNITEQAIVYAIYFAVVSHD